MGMSVAVTKLCPHGGLQWVKGFAIRSLAMKCPTCGNDN
jgi:hypothetical protein